MNENNGGQNNEFENIFGDVLFDITEEDKNKTTIEENINDSVFKPNVSNIFNIEKPKNENKKNNSIKNNEQEKKLFSGHRQRARERFLMNPTAISDYDLLELLLFLIIPRADTKPIAKKMIDKLHNIKGIYEASDEDIESCGCNSQSVKYLMVLIRIVCQRFFFEKLQHKNIIDNRETLIDYCKTLFTNTKAEEFHILLLNNKLNLINEKQFGLSGISDVIVSPREIVKFAIDNQAKHVILTHNHPSGDVFPSQEDISLTDNLFDTLRNIDITLIDHIIICNNNYYSFADEKMLKQ